VQTHFVPVNVFNDVFVLCVNTSCYLYFMEGPHNQHACLMCHISIFLTFSKTKFPSHIARNIFFIAAVVFGKSD